MTRARDLANLLDTNGDVKSSALDNATTSLSDLSVTATATELNTLDGVTASTSEINTMDGVTASTSELNIMDGVTASTSELNLLDGITATTTELNYVDGVTSNIQTQIDNISADLVDDTTPQLGGNLDVNGNEITSASNGDVTINPNGTGDIILDANVGIGTSSPSTSLDVVRNGVQPLRVQSTSGTEVAINMVNTGGNVQLEAHSGNFTIDANNVGIGTTSPVSNIHIDGASAGQADLRFTDTATGETSTDGFVLGLDSAANAYVWNYENDDLYFGTNNAERMRIKADGTWGKAPSGTVLQVKHGIDNTKRTRVGTSWGAIASCPFTITPKSTSSKILVQISTIVSRYNVYGNSYFKLYRGSTDLTASNMTGSFGHWNDYHTAAFTGVGHMQLDSPSTTSAITYKIYSRSSENNLYQAIGGRGYDSAHNYGIRWTLMEIAG
jgi:hypothetical protein